MANTEKTPSKKGSNYDIFKMDALKRFLTYDQKQLIHRLNLDADDNFIYVQFGGRLYRIGRHAALMEWQPLSANMSVTGSPDLPWHEADSNAVLTICDLLCHTEDPFVLSGTFTTLEGLNRVKAGSGKTLGDSFFARTENELDGHVKELAAACEALGGVPMGKGDVAYRIPLFGPLALQISFYESDDEFPAKLTFFLDQDICKFLFFETLWYMIGLMMGILKEEMEAQINRN